MSAPQQVRASDSDASTRWSCAVFAHNEAPCIAACLDSVLAARDELPRTLGIHVLANGCTDRTEAIVAAYARGQGQIRLVSLPVADKAAAWNHYVHDIAPDADMHLMIDGDVQAAPGAPAALARRLVRDPQARAVAALPGTGRSRATWSASIRHFGRLAGALYALRGGFVAALRERGVRLPHGLIGEDLLLSALVKGKPFPAGLIHPDPALAVAPQALFLFRSLSWQRPSDWIAYARRLVRYRVRDHQLVLLLRHLQAQGLEAMPADMEQLYAATNTLPRFRWLGRQTLPEWLALVRLRHDMRRARRRRGPSERSMPPG